jgi:ribosome production factor 2
MIRKPFSMKLQKKNDILPFEDASSIEFFSKKHDTSLFAFGSHSKKRPNNLVLGRLYDGVILDMAEFSIENYKAMNHSSKTMSSFGSKPIIIVN